MCAELVGRSAGRTLSQSLDARRFVFEKTCSRDSCCDRELACPSAVVTVNESYIVAGILEPVFADGLGDFVGKR